LPLRPRIARYAHRSRNVAPPDHQYENDQKIGATLDVVCIVFAIVKCKSSTMQVTFRKRGNAVAMVMPKAILAETGWEVGTLLELRVEAGQIYIKPAEPPASETVE
jgi:hypothetical protein